jgi:hypothetical protein
VNHLKNAESLRDCCDKIKKPMFVNIGLWPYEHGRFPRLIGIDFIFFLDSPLPPTTAAAASSSAKATAAHAMASSTTG